MKQLILLLATVAFVMANPNEDIDISECNLDLREAGYAMELALEHNEDGRDISAYNEMQKTKYFVDKYLVCVDKKLKRSSNARKR
jgi:hypothetical protein